MEWGGGTPKLQEDIHKMVLVLEVYISKKKEGRHPFNDGVVNHECAQCGSGPRLEHNANRP